MRVAPEIVLSDDEREVLDDLIRSKLTSVRLALRARIVLLAAQGLQNKEIALALDVGRIQASRWRERYIESGLEGIERDLPRGAPPSTVDVARLVELTTQSKPKAATHWSTRTMAAELGVSAASVSRHWRKNGLKPHIVRGFKVSRDPRFVEKLEDIVGLYLSPPEHALVLCCDVAALGPPKQAYDGQTSSRLGGGPSDHAAPCRAGRCNGVGRRTPAEPRTACRDGPSCRVAVARI